MCLEKTQLEDCRELLRAPGKRVQSRQSTKTKRMTRKRDGTVRREAVPGSETPDGGRIGGLLVACALALWASSFGAAAALLVESREAHAQSPEALVSTPGVNASSPAVALDATGNVLVVFVEGTEVRFTTGPHFVPGGFAIASGATIPRTPTIHNSSSGVSTVVFARNGDIFRLSNPGGPFTTPHPVTQSAAVDRDPCLAGSAAASGLHLVWVQEGGTGTPQLFHALDFGAPMPFALGDQPALCVDGSGVASIVYERGGDLFYRETQAGVFGPEVVVTTGSGDTSPTVGVTPDGQAHVAFLRGDNIYIAHGDATGFGAAAPLVTQGVAQHPRVAINGTWIEVYYGQAGDVWRLTGTSSFFTTPVNVTQSTGLPEEMHQVAIDATGFPHLVYLRGGALYYRNNVPTPVASFTVTPETGEAPHAVTFSDDSAGPIQSWLWDFGDGISSTEPNPTHVYPDVGSYDVTLTVSGAGGTSFSQQPAAVVVTEPTNIMWIPDVTVTRGQSDICLPVLATHTGEIQGFQVAVTWDCSALDFLSMEITDTDIALLTPEFIGTQESQDPLDCFFSAGVLIDTIPPFDLRTLAPGVDNRLVNLFFDVSPTAPPSLLVDLQSGIGSPPINNIFIVESVNVDPLLFDSVITVLDPATAGTQFIRGDCNSNGVVNLQDIVILLTYLFNGGMDVVCFDAADGNDSGSVDIADSVFIMNFLFNGGRVLPYPFPCPGYDPTPDSIPAC